MIVMRSLLVSLFILGSQLLNRVRSAKINPSEETSLSKYERSCYKAQKYTSENFTQCNFIDWNAVAMFELSKFTVYNPGSSLSDHQQEILAMNITNEILEGRHHISRSCRQAVERFACTEVFASCPFTGSSVSSIPYIPTCKLQCEQVNSICSNDILYCSTYETSECALYIPEDYYLLNSDQGPYDSISIIYGIVFAIWVIATATWVSTSFQESYRSFSYILFAVVAAVLFLKLTVTVLSFVFWRECESLAYMCSKSSTETLLSVQYIYVTWQFICYQLLAKGWMVTREEMGPLEWPFVCCTAAILLVFVWVARDPNYWVLYVIAYTFAYVVICRDALKELSIAYSYLCHVKERNARNGANAPSTDTTLAVSESIDGDIEMSHGDTDDASGYREVSQTLEESGENTSRTQPATTENANLSSAAQVQHSIDDGVVRVKLENALPDLNLRYHMFLYLLIAMMCSIAMEIICHVLYLNRIGSTLGLLILYEFSEIGILGCLLFMFRPRPVSPFFYMVPSSAISVAAYAHVYSLTQSARNVGFEANARNTTPGAADQSFHRLMNPHRTVAPRITPGGGGGDPVGPTDDYEQSSFMRTLTDEQYLLLMQLDYAVADANMGEDDRLPVRENTSASTRTFARRLNNAHRLQMGTENASIQAQRAGTTVYRRLMGDNAVEMAVEEAEFEFYPPPVIELLPNYAAAVIPPFHAPGSPNSTAKKLSDAPSGELKSKNKIQGSRQRKIRNNNKKASSNSDGNDKNSDFVSDEEQENYLSDSEVNDSLLADWQRQRASQIEQFAAQANEQFKIKEHVDVLPLVERILVRPIAETPQQPSGLPTVVNSSSIRNRGRVGIEENVSINVQGAAVFTAHSNSTRSRETNDTSTTISGNGTNSHKFIVVQSPNNELSFGMHSGRNNTNT